MEMEKERVFKENKEEEKRERLSMDYPDKLLTEREKTP